MYYTVLCIIHCIIQLYYLKAEPITGTITGTGLPANRKLVPVPVGRYDQSSSSDLVKVGAHHDSDEMAMVPVTTAMVQDRLGDDDAIARPDPVSSRWLGAGACVRGHVRIRQCVLLYYY